MPSSISFAASTVTRESNTSIYTRPQKKQKMSITQTYFLAHSARGKLSKEAARPDHNLRLLVGHANMLDSLMLDLANAEQEQERWFNKTVSGARHEEEEEEAPAHTHIETVVEEPEIDWQAEDADTSDDESDEEEEALQIKTTDTTVTTMEIDSDEEEDDDEADSGLALVRTPSRHSPPALTLDSESDSEEEHMPPSPPQPMINTLSEKQRRAIATTSYYDLKDAELLSSVQSQSFEQDSYFSSSRQQPTIIAAY